MSVFSKTYGTPINSKTKISPIELWQGKIIKRIKRDISTYPKMREYNFYSNGNATMSGKDLISFYYTIDAYPERVPKSYRATIRKEAKSSVKVSFISTFEPTKIDWSSQQMASKRKIWKELDNSREDVDEYNYVDNIGSMDTTSRRKASLVYLADADVRRRRNLFKYRTMMVVSGRRGLAFDKSVEGIQSYCKNIGVIITRVEEQIPQFLRAFSPFSAELNSGILKQVGSNTIPDEQIARFSVYDQGKIGKGGTLFGTDIYSGFPVYKQFKKRDTDAETILITGETGSGKSVLVKFLITQLIGDPKYNGTINDVEGFEYTPIAGFLNLHDNVLIINMAEGQGCYYDPFEISITGNKDLDKDMFSYSKSFTSSLLCVLIGEKLLSEDAWAQKIVDNAIAEAYTSLGVDEFDSSTWSRTKGYDMFYVYSKFKELYKEYLKLLKTVDKDNLPLHLRYRLNVGYIDALDKVVAKLSEYFEPLSNGGIRANVFRKKVTLSEIVDAKLVINSFGMAGKSSDMIDPVQMALAQLSAANISFIRSVFSKAKGLFNFKVWEEFQRWGTFKGSVNTIKQAITGGRKLGDVNFILTNNVKDLLDDDRFAIFDNISSFAIGSITSATTRERLCNELSVPLLKPDLDAISTQKNNDTDSFKDIDEDGSMYDKAFLLRLDKSVITISKVMLPDYVIESDLFKTGVDLSV